MAQGGGNRVYCNAGFGCFYLVTPRVLTVHATHDLLVVLAVLVVLKILAVLGPRNSSLLTSMFGKSFPVRSIVPGKAPEDVNMAQLNDNMFPASGGKTLKIHRPITSSTDTDTEPNTNAHKCIGLIHQIQTRFSASPISPSLSTPISYRGRPHSPSSWSFGHGIEPFYPSGEVWSAAPAEFVQAAKVDQLRCFPPSQRR